MPEALQATLERLKAERDAANRRYNEALTALDAALRAPPALPPPPAAYDEQQITPLNDAWNIIPAPPHGSGWSGRLTGVIWRTIGPFLQRQLSFNSRLVDHLNRNVAAHRESHGTAAAVIALLREQLARQAEIHSRLLSLLQQITAYVDTRDREAGGGALVLNAALGAATDAAAKRAESMAAREQRYEARTAAIAVAQEDLRVGVSVSQQAVMTVKRELERLSAGSGAAAPGTGPSAPAERPAGDALRSRLNAYKYVGFEDEFRGSQEVIRARLESYLPHFAGRSHVLDVGCGRGELLDLLRARGIGARGLDVNSEMVEVCRGRGLDVAHADAVGWLSTLPDGALDGLFAAQVVEHLQPDYLLRFLELAYAKLAPGAPIVLETLNPACWVAFFESYIRDITHVWPLHPDTLKYLVIASGFASAQIVYSSPVPEPDRLQPLHVAAATDLALADLAETFNANVEKLNARLFTHLDYAIIGRR